MSNNIIFLIIKKIGKALLLMASLLLMQHFCFGQSNTINPGLLRGSWSAHWITCPNVPARAYGVYHFRKDFSLVKPPDHFIIHVSGDNRYHLFVNGKSVGRGPARGDLYNWHFATYDIAPYLKDGKNVIAAKVWNMAEYAPVAQVTNRTGFLVQGDQQQEEIVNTNHSWKVLKDSAYQTCAVNVGAILHSYFVVGPGDEVNAVAYPWGWQEIAYDDQNWNAAEVIGTPVVPVGYGSDDQWILAPRTIPQMEETQRRLTAIRQDSGMNVNNDFLIGGNPLHIPANKKVSILIDQSYETTAYPVLITSGGKGASIKMTYAEALFDSLGNKGNRDSITGKTMKGLYDIFHPDGGDNRSFSPLWFRTYRYLQLNITTADEPLVINDLYGLYTGYPFERKATFVSNDSSLQDIWKVGWRTARLCAGETYYDCPYYEELQYEADTRIQALISLYNTGDDRLMRKAINDFYDSRLPMGLTQGRYPSNRQQVIPPFSLFWVSMLYDYWMHRPDEQFVKKYLDAAQLVLKWYQYHIDSSKNMLGAMDWWNFVDWDNSFPGGTPPGANDGNSSVITLQYVYTLHQAADMFAYFGEKDLAQKYQHIASQLSMGTYDNCFDHKRMEMANTPGDTSFSQHASIIGILSGAIPQQQYKQVMQNILSDSSLSQATFYYRFYLTRAMKKAGMADQYYSQLTPWRNMLKKGLTTFAENPDPTRSDCHGWSASPIYDFLATICGIVPADHGFSKVIIAPALGTLKEVRASMPHPQGMIKVHLHRKEGNHIHAEIDLPGTLTGTFEWQGKTIALKGGEQEIDL